MRIAHFIQRYPPALGGSEAYFARLSRHCAQQGDDVTVFTSNALALAAFWDRAGATLPAGVATQDGAVIRRYAMVRWPGRRYVLKALSLVPWRFWQCLTITCNPICPAMWGDCGRDAPRFDAVHASAFPYAWPIACGLRLARRQGIPFLLTPFLHLGDPTDRRDRTRRGYLVPALRWLLRQADAVFAQTPTERDALLALGLSAARVHLQGLGVDVAECTGGDRTAARQRWEVEAEAVVIGHLANHSADKGTVDLLLAAEQLWRTGVAVRVVLAGPEMPAFQAFWMDFAGRNPEATRRRVVRLGVLTEADKQDFFAGIDVFALPSRSDSFGLVLLEAWANGVPNVAYRAGGVADVIQTGRDGLLVPCGDIGALAQALAELQRDPCQRKTLGAAGLARLATEFRWADKLGLVRAVMQQLMRTSRTVG